MHKRQKYQTTEIFQKYYSKSIEEFPTFMEKIACARVNFINGKNKAPGLSLTQAAKKIGISIVYLSNLEQGVRATRDVIIIRNIENFYRFSHGYLIELIINELSMKNKHS
jgi:hypothetical protein